MSFPIFPVNKMSTVTHPPVEGDIFAGCSGSGNNELFTEGGSTRGCLRHLAAVHFPQECQHEGVTVV